MFSRQRKSGCGGGIGRLDGLVNELFAEGQEEVKRKKKASDSESLIRLLLATGCWLVAKTSRLTSGRAAGGRFGNQQR